MSIESVMPSTHLIYPFSSCLQSFPASEFFPRSQFFASGSQSFGVSASNISPSNEYSGLISFRMDWLDPLAVQGTLKSLLQHHSSKALLRMEHPGSGYSPCLPGALGPKRKMDGQTASHTVWGDHTGEAVVLSERPGEHNSLHLAGSGKVPQRRSPAGV